MRRACCIAVLSLCLATVLASLPCTVWAQKTDLEYTPEQIENTSTQAFLEWMAKPQPGYETFAAMHALGKKAKNGSAEERWKILSEVIEVMNDPTRTGYQRFQCCYVICDSGDEQWVPNLVYVLGNDPSETMRSVAAEALGRFTKSTAARSALSQAAKVEKSKKVLEVIERALGIGYTPEQIRSIPAEAFLEYMKQAEPGYTAFAAMHALASKAKQSDASGRQAILTMVVNAMNDKARVELQRWQCCYVISGCGDEKWVPSLATVLSKDPSATMRSVAAEALGQFPKSAAARSALQTALQNEKSQKVIDVITRVLKTEATATL